MVDSAVMSAGRAIPSSTDIPSPSVSAWLEFMAVGGATLLVLPVAWMLKRTFGIADAELAAGFTTSYGAYVINDPHFAVTYVLFYRNARERALGAGVRWSHRARYLAVAAAVPLGLIVWCTYALHARSAQSLGWMIQLMFLLVGWHYVKQGFGVMNVLSARRGHRIERGERRIILVHCFACWAYAWASPSTAAGEFEEKGIVYSALAHPRWLEKITAFALAASTVALLGMLVAKWRRERRLFPAAPLAGLLITLWSWTIYSSAERVLQYAIPALHSIQYIYFVWLMKRNEARAHEGPPTFGRPVAVRLGALALSALGLGWLLFRGAPTLLDDLLRAGTKVRGGSEPLGATPCFAAAFVMINIHHYFMDAVIWRRDNPDTRYLTDPCSYGHS
jgi:hypothetical protein